MSQACGGTLDFIDGGVLKNPSILNGQISTSHISGSVLDSSQITSLASIDQQSVDTIFGMMGDNGIQTIFNRILALPQNQLQDLASILQNIMEKAPTKPGVDPVESTDVELPTTVLGSRAALLGEPNVFAQYDDDYVVPLYRSKA